MDDLTQYLPKVLIGFGAALQFARQFKGVPEWTYHVAAVLLCAIGYFLTVPITGASIRAEVVQLIVWLPDHLPLVWGGTFAMSNVAKAAQGTIKPALNPLTDSK